MVSEIYLTRLLATKVRYSISVYMKKKLGAAIGNEFLIFRIIVYLVCVMLQTDFSQIYIVM